MAMVGELGAFSLRDTASRFSCELLGSNASLEGTGVESFCAGFAFGKKLALVSFRQELGSEETCARAAGEGVAAGDDFWKNDMIDFCLAEEETDTAAFAGWRAGVRVALALSPAILHEAAGECVCCVYVRAAGRRGRVSAQQLFKRVQQAGAGIGKRQTMTRCSENREGRHRRWMDGRIPSTLTWRVVKSRSGQGPRVK